MQSRRTAQIVNTARLLLAEFQLEHLFLLHILQVHYVTNLSCGQCVDYWLAFVCDFDLLLAVADHLCQELVGCLRITFRLDQNHTSTNSIRVLLQPLLGIV